MRRAAHAQNQQQRPYRVNHQANHNRQIGYNHHDRHNAYANVAIREDATEIVRLGHFFQRESRAAGIIVPELAIRNFLNHWREQTVHYYD